MVCVVDSLLALPIYVTDLQFFIRNSLTSFFLIILHRLLEMNFAFPVTNVVLQDGNPAAVGVRVVAVTASNGGNYSVGDTGVIVRIELSNTTSIHICKPVVLWDHSGKEHQSSCAKLNVTNVILQDGTPAAVGVRVVAIAASQDGNYDIGHTGVICSIPSHVNPMVRWDHSGEEHQSSRAKLNVTKRRVTFGDDGNLEEVHEIDNSRPASTHLSHE